MANQEITTTEEEVEEGELDNETIERQAISLVNDERVAWDNSIAFVTDRVAFKMKDLIRNVRRNYWGIFEAPIDPLTGKEKIWIPLTESTVDAVVKNCDLDTKDINFSSRKPFAVIGTSILRSITRYFLDKNKFGEKLDQLEKDGAIDGVAVWKTFKEKINGKVQMVVKKVDALNIYIDPTADNIQDAYRFTERALMTPTEISEMSDWINTENLKGELGLHPTDRDLKGTTTGTTIKTRDVYELWGKIPLSLITGKKKDEKEEVGGRIVVSGLETPGGEKLHLIRRNRKGLKPYEEFQYNKIAGRWAGRGVGEKLLFLQLWINIIKNIHINRSYVSQLGLFKVRKGRGLTPQMFSKLSANGVITVQDMGDIEPLIIQEASNASYKDEDIISNWAMRTTSAFEVVTGEQLPSGTTATATAIQSRSSQSQFVLVKEQLGMFLDRWLMKHALPIMIDTLDENELVNIVGSVEQLKEFDRVIIEQKTKEFAYKKTEETGFTPTDIELDMVREQLTKQVEGLGKDRFVRIKKSLLKLVDYQLEVMITNEKQDVGVLSKNLLAALGIAPEFRTQILQKLFDIIGLDFRPEEREEVPAGLTRAMRPPAEFGTQSPEKQLTQAVI